MPWQRRLCKGAPPGKCRWPGLVTLCAPLRRTQRTRGEGYRHRGSGWRGPETWCGLREVMQGACTRHPTIMRGQTRAPFNDSASPGVRVGGLVRGPKFFFCVPKIGQLFFRAFKQSQIFSGAFGANWLRPKMFFRAFASSKDSTPPPPPVNEPWGRRHDGNIRHGHCHPTQCSVGRDRPALVHIMRVAGAGPTRSTRRGPRGRASRAGALRGTGNFGCPSRKLGWLTVVCPLPR